MLYRIVLYRIVFYTDSNPLRNGSFQFFANLALDFNVLLADIYVCLSRLNANTPTTSEPTPENITYDYDMWILSRALIPKRLA